jgi:hypothetical protein
VKTDPASVPPSPEDISRRAYELWQTAGSPDHASEEHWLQAERELFSARSAAPAQGGSSAPTGVAASTTPNSASGSSSISGQGATSSGSGRGGR